MYKLIKVLLALVIILGLLLAAAVVIVPQVIDPNDYRDKIVSLVKDKTGMALAIDGRIELSFFPWLGLKTGPLRLRDPDYPDAPALMQVQKSSVRIKLLPLFRKKVQADTIALDGLNVNLITFKNGKTNWQKLIAGGTSKTSTPTKPGAAAIVFAIAGFTVHDGKLVLDDRKNGQKHLIRQLTLQSGAIHSGVTTGIKLTANVASTSLPTAVTIDTKFDIAVADDMSTATLSRLTISLVNPKKQHVDLALDKADITIKTLKSNLSGLTLTTSGLPVNGKLNMKLAVVDINKESVSIPSLNLSSDAGTATLSAKVNKMLSAPAISTQFKFSKIDPARIAAVFAPGKSPDALKMVNNIALSGMASYDNNRVSVTKLQGQLALAATGSEPMKVALVVPSIKANLRNETFDIPTIKLASTVINLTASAKGQYKPAYPDLRGKIELPATNIKRLLKLLNISVQTSDPTAMTNIALTSPFHYQGRSAILASIKGRIDDTSIAGYAGITLGKRVRYRYKLRLGKLDADRYLPPAERTAAPAPAGKTVSGVQMLAAPIGLAKEMNMDGHLTLEQLKIAGFIVNNILLGIKGNNGLVQLSPLQASLYEGKITGSASFDARQKNSPITLQMNLAQMEIGSVLSVLKVTDKLRAKGEIKTNLRLTANNNQPLLHTLSGPIAFKLKDGLIKGFDLRKIIIDAQKLLNQTARYKGKLDKLAKEATGKDSDQFRFTAMSGSLVFKSGNGRNDDLSIKSPLFRITGRGDVSLPAEKINYLMNVNVVKSLKGQGGKDLNQLKGLDIPIRIHGSLTDPGFKVDLKQLLKKKLQKKFARKKEKYRKKLQKKLDKVILKKLGGSKATQDSTTMGQETDPRKKAVKDLGKKLLQGLFK